MNRNTFRHYITALSGILFSLALAISGCFPAYAATFEDRVNAQKARPIESNATEGWPDGPVVTADSAILMEAGTGTILYAKNIHQAQYPASCTKILTCLIAAEQCEMDEIVTMSHKAVFDTPLDSSYISLDVGNQITLEQALNAVLVSSANNVAYAVAEHVVGSDWENFAPVMNERARELGCVDSHFVNPNGLPDENHYTSAYDLAMIGRAFFDNELLCKITRTSQLHLEPTPTQPKDIRENSGNQLLPGKPMAYEYLVGSKTGFTNAARSCLVSCAEKDELKLICVVLKDESPLQFEDTVSLFEYGFNNFRKVNVSESETRYNINTTDIFYSENDILGSSKPLLALDASDYLVLPNTAVFSDTVSSLSYDTEEEKQAAVITYTYNGVTVGKASVDFVAENSGSYIFGDIKEDPGASASGTAPGLGAPVSETLSDPGSGTPQNAPSETGSAKGEEDSPVVLINLKEAVLWTAVILAVLSLAAIVVKFVRGARQSSRSRRRPRRYFIADDNPYLNVSEDLRRKRREASKHAKEHRRRAKRPNRFRDYDY